MRKLLSLLILTAMLVTTVSPVFAQEPPDTDEPADAQHIYLPQVSNGGSPDQTLTPNDPAQQPAEPQPTAPPETPPTASPAPPAYETPPYLIDHRVYPADRIAAAANNRAKGLLPGLAAANGQGVSSAAAVNPWDVPHYFGPFGNYANSPMPHGSIASITVDVPGDGYLQPTVDILDVFNLGSGATAEAVLGAGGVIAAINVTNGGNGYVAPIVVIDDVQGMGIDAAATPNLGNLAGGIRKFVDSLPGLNFDGRNNLNSNIPVAIPDQNIFPGADYYEMEIDQFTQILHSDLPPTTLRGYRQTNTTDANVSAFHYLGPLIITQRNRPVRIKFTNHLPTGEDGKLFVPFDTTLMGGGMGPKNADGTTCNPMDGENCALYPQNRAVLHMHGGLTPWISDGTPYQWITPLNETTPYTRGASVMNVPDMWFDVNGNVSATQTVTATTNDPGRGSQTYYYTNAQSGRLLFYHDHSEGMTRLGVYVGGVAAYLITDPVELDLINGTNVTGVNLTPPVAVLPSIGIPLIFQDKSFVFSDTIAAQDPNWKWGTGTIISDTTPIKIRAPRTGDLWVPNVYMPAQNPYDLSGANAFGRWQYGPWFWPPTPITYPPVPNVYYDPACDGSTGWCEPPFMPTLPNPSMGMEAYNDTMMVNGNLYPYLNVDPKTYRFRVLNGANDRFVNLNLYVADPSVVASTGVSNTEVKMVPAMKTAGFPSKWSTDGREGGVPDPATRGPSWIQIGTEGGFLPAPVVIPPQPINWNMNATAFNVGNVTDHSLLLGPAERVDVLVDFSQFAGKTLLVYNDAPAAFPALDSRYDYYTGNPSQMDTGGAPSTQPGYAPNTRTIMQIRVANTTPAAPYDLTVLKQVFAKTASKRGVFETSQEPIIVPQAGYNSAYNANFPGDWRAYVRIFDTAMTFTPITATVPVTIPFQPKAMHDEMGASFDPDYGRMSGNLGIEVPGATALTQNIILYGYASPPTDLVTDSTMTQIGAANDGTQIWKITHNGVDTHPIHWHLFDLQLINHVAWDGVILPPDANELGWKETIRVNPLEDTIVAMRPRTPPVPFDIPNSVRLIDPNMPEGVVLEGDPVAFVDPELNAVKVINHYVNYGWEYVWHCHILSHEEMDMMHSMLLGVAPRVPSGLAYTINGSGTGRQVVLTWTDNSLGETGFSIQRATNVGFTAGVVTFTVGVNIKTYADTIGTSTLTYYYRVAGHNTFGDTYVYPAPAIGFPNQTVLSAFSSPVQVGLAVRPEPPTNFTSAVLAGPQIRLNWTASVLATSYVLTRAGGTAVAAVTVNGGATTTYLDTRSLQPGITYTYTLVAVNGNSNPPLSSTPPVATSVSVPLPAPGNLRQTARTNNSISLSWNASATGAGYQLQRSPTGATGTWSTVTPIGFTGTSYTDRGLATVTTYWYQVIATVPPTAPFTLTSAPSTAISVRTR